MHKALKNHQAIIFLNDKHQVVKEILYPEFEAVLDHYVGMLDFENQTLKAAYLQIDYQLNITGAVFFVIAFESRGFIDKHWNIPLLQVLDKAESGPNLGAGPIRLCTADQCSMPSIQSDFWTPPDDVFITLQQAIKRNNLCLTTPIETHQSPGATEPLGGMPGAQTEQLGLQVRQQLEAEYDSRLSTVMATAEAAHTHSLDSVRIELEQLKDALSSAKDVIRDEKNKNRLLKETLDNQANELQRAREKYQKEISKVETINGSQLEALQEQFELEAKARVDAACKELKERLEMREGELFHRDQKIADQRMELERLKQQQALMHGGEDNLLNKMIDSGLIFVADYPGGDQLTVPFEQIPQYLKAPMQYLADFCGVDVAVYKQWLYHCELPVCNASLESGRMCGKPIEKVSKPKKFIPGESDRCSSHRQSSSQLQDLIQMRSPN